MLYIAQFGGIIFTYPAGTEIDTKLFREYFKESFLVGFFSFLIPFAGAFLFAYYFAGWGFRSSFIALRDRLIHSIAGRRIFRPGGNRTDENTNRETADGRHIRHGYGHGARFEHHVHSVGHFHCRVYRESILLILSVDRFSPYILNHPVDFNKVIEPEIKFISLMLLIVIFFAQLVRPSGRHH